MAFVFYTASLPEIVGESISLGYLTALVLVFAVAAAKGPMFGASFFGLLLLFQWVIPPVGLVLFGYKLLIQALFKWIVFLPPGLPAIIVGIVAVASSGFALFFFRLIFRVLYGVSEVAVGVGLAAHKINSEFTGVSDLRFDLFLFLLTAAVYLIVRGLDNIHQGFTKEPKDKFIARITRRRT